MPVTSIFSFSLNVFYPLYIKFHLFINSYSVFCKRFQFCPVYKFVIWDRMKLSLYRKTKIWALNKLKAFADGRFNVAEMLITFFDRVENIGGKRIKCWLQHFLLFKRCFQKPPWTGSLKHGVVW